MIGGIYPGQMYPGGSPSYGESPVIPTVGLAVLGAVLMMGSSLSGLDMNPAEGLSGVRMAGSTLSDVELEG